MSDDLQQRLAALRCGDNSCVLGAPGGMGTNGGCQCASMKPLAHTHRSVREWSQSVARLAREAMAEVDRLRAENERLRLDLQNSLGHRRRE